MDLLRTDRIQGLILPARRSPGSGPFSGSRRSTCLDVSLFWKFPDSRCAPVLDVLGSWTFPDLQDVPWFYTLPDLHDVLRF